MVDFHFQTPTHSFPSKNIKIATLKKGEVESFKRAPLGRASRIALLNFGLLTCFAVNDSVKQIRFFGSVYRKVFFTALNSCLLTYAPPIIRFSATCLYMKSFVRYPACAVLLKSLSEFTAQFTTGPSITGHAPFFNSHYFCLSFGCFLNAHGYRATACAGFS